VLGKCTWNRFFCYRIVYSTNASATASLLVA
jgi:hypothetical protein